MMKPEFSTLVLLIAATGAIAAVTAVHGTSIHERKEVAGLAVVFGAEPEPALTEEIQFLRWRVSTLVGEEAYVDLQDAAVVVKHEGEEFGPFQVRGTRRQPGSYETRHVFTKPGDYESVLTFRKGDDEAIHTVDFSFTINDRRDLEIPKRRGGGS